MKKSELKLIVKLDLEAKDMPKEKVKKYCSKDLLAF